MTYGLMPIATILTALAFSAAPAAGVIKTPLAAADGLPIDRGVGNDGVENLSGSERYVTLKAGRGKEQPGTVVARIQQDTGRVMGSIYVPGEWTVPAVAYDGSPAGLSADGARLALIKPRAGFPRRTTELAVLNSQRMTLPRRFTLDGDFSIDAISPDGSTLYLVEYPNPRRPTVYRVRIYDVAAQRLLDKPLIDSRLAAVVMRGLPVTRANSPDGATAYTLYDGQGNGPFIHALDTVERSALCILLPMVDRKADPWRMKLAVSADGRELDVVGKDRTLATVDTRTAKARRPGERPVAEEEKSSAVGIVGGLLALGALAAGGLSLTRRRQPSSKRRNGV
jgi:hypothetical protein